MTNKRLILIGLAANALLVVVGALAVHLLTGEPPSAVDAPQGAPAALPPPRDEAPPRFVPAPAAPDVPTRLGTPPVAPKVPRAVFSAMRVPADPEGQRLAGERRKALRALRAQLMEGFSALRAAVDACDAKGASFVLELEAGDGLVFVRGARVAEAGTSPEGALSCARAALVGRTIPAPSITPGRRWDAPL